MSVQTFRDLLAQRPFKPFRLVMSSGKTYEVRQPELAWLTRTDIYVGVGKLMTASRRSFICSLFQVLSVEPLNTAPSRPGECSV